ncbi:MAG: hypothetical protein P1U63_07835 [Coxiellaceae bacterium]|nr:hypothetical protein [Coxiellaceae bacterium]
MRNTTWDAAGEVAQGWLTAAVDTTLTWVPFATGRFREAWSGPGKKFSAGVPAVMQELARGRPFFPTVFQYGKGAPLDTVKHLYKGAGTFYCTTYAWLVAAEFGTSSVARAYGLSDRQSTFLAGLVGGIVATPGEQQMINGRKVSEIWRMGLRQTVRQAYGCAPTIVRELVFAEVAVSGIQRKASHAIAQRWQLDKKSVWTNFLGASVCSPLLLLTQPPARFAAAAQLSKQGVFATNKMLMQEAKLAIKKLPEGTGLVQQLLVGTKVAYFPGGGARLAAIVGTGMIYGVMRGAFEQESTDTESSTLRNS